MKYPRYKYFYAFCDFIFWVISFTEAKALIAFYNKEYFNTVLDLKMFSLYVIVISVIMILIFQSNNLYKLHVFLNKSMHLTAIIRSLLSGFITFVVISFWIKLPSIPNGRLFVLAFAVISLVNFTIFRVFLLRKLYLGFKKYNILTRNILIWGAGNGGRSLAAKLIFEESYGVKILGFIDDFVGTGTEIINGLKVIGSGKTLRNLKDKFKIDEIIVTIDKVGYEKLIEILDECNDLEINVKLTSELFKIIPQKIVTEVYSGIPVIDLSPMIGRNFNFICKRITDITVSLIGLLVLSPIFFIISVLIKLSSKGPIIYKQVRIGKDGKPFMFYKFRTMKLSNDDDPVRRDLMIDFMKNGKAQNENNTKIINNSRVTKIGQTLRKTSFDELPQLFNVLKGEMTLVGPRPCLQYEYQNYDEWQKKRLSVLPGCTGIWQVSGRSSVSFNDSVILDIYYVNNISPWLDIQLILKTIPVMLFAKGGR